MTTATDLTALLAHDTSDMLGAIATLPAQLADGRQRAEASADAIHVAWPKDDGATPRSLVVCGMGGSGVGADLLPAAVEDLQVPVIAVKGYDLPSWVNDEDRVICCSYSGATSETLACFRQAVERSVVAAVITTGGELAELARANDVPVVTLPGGMQPRAAVGVLFGALATVAGFLNVVPHSSRVIDEAAEGAKLVIDEHAGAGDDLPGLRFARELHDHVVIVYGAAHTEAVAHRWKAQINENTKVPCWASAYPELDHNELVGWEFARETGGRFAVVELLPYQASDAIRARFDITKRIAAPSLDTDLRFEPRASSRAAATFEQLVWGDYVSVYGALVRGIDPTPVERIHVLKGELAGR
jgi:glucose/mannose-6-phosphate isomerase